jgi:hypothetical protein
LQRFRYPGDSHALDLARELSALGIALAGFALRVATVGFVPKGTSGRGTRRLKAHELNTTGIYSVVRHPLYLANFLIFLGFLVALAHAWLLVSSAALYWLYYERIILAEEGFLRARHGTDYQVWAATTPALVPRLSRWRRPALPFCWRSALRREYATLYMLVSTFAVIELAGDYRVRGCVVLDPFWAYAFGLCTAFYAGVRVIKKQTRLLAVGGR